MADDIVNRLRSVKTSTAENCEELSLITEEAAAEIEHLRVAGDTLAHHVRAGESKEMYSAVHAWEEARRG